MASENNLSLDCYMMDGRALKALKLPEFQQEMDGKPEAFSLKEDGE